LPVISDVIPVTKIGIITYSGQQFDKVVRNSNLKITREDYT